MAKKIKSIMQDKEAGQCYLCRLLHRDYSIKPVRQEHHVMGGTANRKLSDKYGLTVYLDPDHHLYGPEAVHKNAEVAKILHREGQKAFERNYPDLDFYTIFRRNYLTENERAYERNPKFRQYVDKYCEHRGIAIAEGLQHESVSRVREEYEGDRDEGEH